MGKLRDLRRRLHRRLQEQKTDRPGGFLPEQDGPVEPAATNLATGFLPAAGQSRSADLPDPGPADTAGPASDAMLPGEVMPVTGSQAPLPPAVAAGTEPFSFLPALQEPPAGPRQTASAPPTGFLPESQPAPVKPVQPRLLAAAPAPAPLEELAPVVEVETSWGTCARVGWTAAELDPSLVGWRERLLAARGGPPQLAEAFERGAEGWLFCDLETCGLRHEPLFLVGTARVTADGFRTDLFLARSLREEPAAMAAAGELMAHANTLVTFNGLTFDLPYLSRRSARFDLDLPWPTGQVDLLPLARERYRRAHRNCRLKTLEAAVCGIVRAEADPPSGEIPEIYRKYLADGNGRQLLPVLRHCAMDLLTLAALATCLAEGDADQAAAEARQAG